MVELRSLSLVALNDAINKGAFGFVTGTTTFRIPNNTRQDVLDRLTRLLCDQLPLLSANMLLVDQSKDSTVRLAAESQAQIDACTLQFAKFLRGVIQAGFRSAGSWLFIPHALATDRLTNVIVASLTLGCRFLIKPMAVQKLMASPAKQVREYYIAETRTAASKTAERMLLDVEGLFAIMAVGLVEFLDGAAGRVLYCRGPGQPNKGLHPFVLSSPNIKHPGCENLGQWVATLDELLDIKLKDITQLPPVSPSRVFGLFEVIPDWLRPAITGFSGRVMRRGSAMIGPAKGQRSLADVPTYLKYFAITFANELVLAAWSEEECPGVLWRLFGG